jgi:hypothetical protein
MFIKIGEIQDIQLESTASCVPEVSFEVLESFRKTANELKKIAPKADDFLYFSAVMMHAAEASAINDDGTPKLNLRGEVVKVGWDTSNNTWKWQSNDPNIKAYKNVNGDIFPELELIKAHKKWKHKPLCIDHKSSSVDHTRGFIVDTYYDRNLKRVIALCALDKANYPDLARKVSSHMQSAVSMGTAVGRAICYDCGRVARAEADFCAHMKNKSCYGEINVDLNPIELSIVVNGADPKANIKNIIAAANTMNTYLGNRAEELKKLAEVKYTANFSVEDSNSNNVKTQNLSVSSSDLEDFKKEVEEAFVKLKEFKDAENDKEEELSAQDHDLSSKDSNFSTFNQSSGSIAMDEGSPTDSGLSLQTPQNERYASIAELHNITAAIEETLSHMKSSLNKLTKTSTNTQEENMSGSEKLSKQGYFQGGGGVNEPTPGQVKYPKDPLNEQLREKEDKQMVGQSPFPEVGDVDGMHPSPASVDPSNELERKKMMARAEIAERAMKRNAVVQLAKDTLANKQAYWQGGGGVNEPEPGKVKYPKDKLNEELRNYEDKQMVGQSPFPGVGSVDGLHPSPSSSNQKDELKRKEMLARAQLKARFVKASNNDGSQNKAKSAWEVFQGDRLLLSASVQDLCGGKVSDVLYDSIATKPFGIQLIERVKVNGAEAVSKLIKKAAPGDQPPMPAAPAPGPDTSGPDAPSGDMEAPALDRGGKGDPKETALELAEKNVTLSSDLLEAVRALAGEKAEIASDGDASGMAADDSVSDKSASYTLNVLRKELNGALTQAMKESIAELNDHQQELQMIVEMSDNGSLNSNQDLLGTVVDDALNEAKTSLADGFKLMTAFVKYARGTKEIVKRAEIEAELQALAEGDSMDDMDSASADGADLMSLINDTNADLDSVTEMMDTDEDTDKDTDQDSDFDLKDLDGMDDLTLADDVDDNDVISVDTPSQAAEVAKQAPDASVMVHASLNSRSGRQMLRAKLAADALGKQEDGEISDMSKQKWSNMLDQADKLTDGQTELDIKPSDNLGLVETLPEINKRMMEVAKMPPKVRKEAESIQRMVSEGKLDPKDVDSLSSLGLDKDAVAYWKKFYGEVDGGSEFASELVKEHVKASVEGELNNFKVKLARAYELAYDMAERGLCRNEKSAISTQVEEIMTFSDKNFESLKRVVARTEPAMSKQASRIPQVGLLREASDRTAELVETDDFDLLSSAFGTKKSAF